MSTDAAPKRGSTCLIYLHVINLLTTECIRKHYHGCITRHHDGCTRKHYDGDMREGCIKTELSEPNGRRVDGCIRKHCHGCIRKHHDAHGDMPEGCKRRQL